MVWRTQGRRSLLRGGIIGGLLVLSAAAGLLADVERWGLNQLFHLRGPIPPENPIVIVSIDEDSFDELNLPWPWPRSLHGQFLDVISRGRPAVVGFDVLFAEPSSYGVEDDQALAEAVTRAGNVVLGAALTVVDDPRYVKRDLNPPVPTIRRGAAGFGPVNFVVDDDAFVRRAVLHLRHQDRPLPHFVLQIYDLARQQGLSGVPPPAGEFLINYRGGPRSFATVPYYRVLLGEVPPELFAGKIVLVGATTPVLQDVHPTPFATQGAMPGVEIHANTLETLFEGQAIHRASLALIALATLVTATLIVWGTDRLAPLPALAVAGALVLIGVGVAYGALTRAALWVPVAPVIGAALAGYGATVVENFIKEQREKRRLARFFSPAVLKEIVRHRSDLALGTARRPITVLFSDVRGFTSLSERLAPEQVVEILKEYLTELTEVVFRHGGTVDKYIGDCIMALYNVPFEDPGHAAAAVRTALDFQERTRQISDRWEAKLGIQLRNGVGINTGDAVVGTMGSRQRLEYTAIGDTVNLAARLESLTKEHGTGIIISESTYREVCGQFRTRYLGRVTVKGKEVPVRIYGVLEAVRGDVRQAPRVPFEAAVALREEGRTLSATLRDMSRSGVGVAHLPNGLSPGAIERLRFQLPVDGQVVEADGSVTWCVDDKAGFRFVDLEPVARAAIEGFVSGRITSSHSA